MTTTFIGCDELREWLVAQGFKIALDSLRSDSNGCNWYAYRKTILEARECELNKGKQKQIVVQPYSFERPGHSTWESVQLDVTGQAGGVAYKLQAYSMAPDEFKRRLEEIERSLVAAWNSLKG